MDSKIVFLLFSALIYLTMESEAAKIVEGNKAFALKMHKILSKEEGNIISSPFSAHVVLTMAYQGAAGSTSNAFSKVLGVPDAASAADEYHTLLGKLKDVKSVTLNIANKIITQQGFTLQNDFKAVVSDKFSSEAEEMNFADNVNSAKAINTWVEKKTNDKIHELITADSLNSDTRLVLLNAVYFKGSWAKKFNKDLTKKETFYLLNGEETKVDMMHLNGKFRYSENAQLNAKVLEMPYEGHDMSMIVILPNERNGIKDVENKLSEVNFSEMAREMRTFEVDISLPKFKIETEIPMNDMLSEMGLDVMFSDDANFSKIAANGEQLKVSKVIQKAFLEVNEEGSEAAAATGMVMVAYSMPMPLPRSVFQADHPFVVYIMDNHNPNILFLGRLMKPE